MEYDFQKIIMEHYSNPTHLDSSLNEENHFTKYSDTCVDKIIFDMKKIDNKIYLKHKTIGCAICVASTDLLIDKIQGNSTENSIKLVEKYQNLISQLIEQDDELGELNIFANVKQHLNRFHCANLIALGLLELIN